MKKSKAFAFGLIISFLILVISVGYLIYSKLNSHIISDVMILIPIVAFGVSVVIVLIKRVPDIIKLTFPVLIFAVSLFSFYWLNCVGGYVEFRTLHGVNEIKEYYTDFSFNKFGKYEDIFNYQYHSTGIFQQEAYTTILKYDKKSFEEEINDIDMNYKFYDHSIVDGEPEPFFTFDGFDFRIEKSKSPKEWYPKQLYLIGINKTSYEIAYVYFQDYDLDCVSDFNDILDYYCGWQYVVEDRKSN